MMQENDQHEVLKRYEKLYRELISFFHSNSALHLNEAYQRGKILAEELEASIASGNFSGDSILYIKKLHSLLEHQILKKMVWKS